MIFIIVAMNCEAKPVIENLELMRITDETKIQIFHKEEIYLVITGTGGVSATIAATYALTKYGTGKSDIIISYGICAAFTQDETFRELYGQIFQIKKITNMCNLRDFYPDIIVKTPFPKADILTLPFVYESEFYDSNSSQNDFSVSNSIKTAKEIFKNEYNKILTFSYIEHTKNQNDNSIVKSATLIDMESAFIYEACIKFTYSHNIFVFKIVSDNGDSKKFTPSDVSALVLAKEPEITAFISKIKNEILQQSKATHNIPRPLQESLIEISKNLRLTDYQIKELVKLTENAFIREKNLKEIFDDTLVTQVKNKVEGKSKYGELRKKLLEP